MSRESKRRDVELLLWDYQAWHAARGGTLSPDESHLRTASYGPGGYIESGGEFEPKDRRRLRESFRALDHALTILKASEPNLYVVLRRPYLMDGADASLVAEWRKKAERGVRDAKEAVEEHDLAVRILCVLLHRTKLYAVPPKRSNSRDAESVEKRNDEAYDAYLRFMREGNSKKKAVEEAAKFSDYSEDRIYKIVSVREPKNRTC